MLNDAKYTTFTATPFVPPTYPATLTISTGTDQVQGLNLQEIHKYAKNHQVAYILIDKDELNTAYQDLARRFPMQSTQRNEYILIGYHYDSNCIIAHPVKKRTAQVLTTAWKNLHHKFSKAGTAPEVWVMDNEISSELKTSFEIKNTSFHLVPPNSHCRNIAERAIQTYKNHFKAGLATTDPKFPLSEWD